MTRGGWRQMESVQRTVSTFVPNTMEGTHVFSVMGHSQIYGRGHEFITSGTFVVGGFHWAIVLYPDAHVIILDDDDDDITAFLELQRQGGGKGKVRVSCDIRLVDQTTSLASLAHLNGKTFKVFNADETNRVNCLKMKRSEFEVPPYLVDDRIILECVVRIKKELRVLRARPVPRIKVLPSNIMQQLCDLLEYKEGADVFFDVAGEIFAADKLVLTMRSSVFKAELYGPMRENGIEPISIMDMQPVVLKALLQCIYMDWLPAIHDFEGDDNGEMIQHLLVARTADMLWTG